MFYKVTLSSLQHHLTTFDHRYWVQSSGQCQHFFIVYANKVENPIWVHQHQRTETTKCTVVGFTSFPSDGFTTYKATVESHLCEKDKSRKNKMYTKIQTLKTISMRKHRHITIKNPVIENCFCLIQAFLDLRCWCGDK